MKAPRITPARVARAARRLGSGFWAFVLDVLLFQALVLIWNQHRLVSFAAAFLVSCTCRYIIDRHYTYRPATASSHRKEAPLGRQFRLYLGACCAALVVGILAFYWGQHLGLGPLLSKLFSVPFAGGASALLFRFAVFRTPRARRAGSPQGMAKPWASRHKGDLP